MKYQIAERFKSIQGEGVYAGTPMAFIRFVGCSVGKRICQHCDTVFEQMLPWQGGGEFDVLELLDWAGDYLHICLTGGEPLDQDLEPLLRLSSPTRMFHLETSGTKSWSDLKPQSAWDDYPHKRIWKCVSPKPGFLEEVVMAADEVKVIVPGLGELNTAVLQGIRATRPELDGTALRWPTIDDALRWARAGKTVFLQPRNAKYDVDHHNLMICQDIIREHPELRLSVQMHKILKVQ